MAGVADLVFLLDATGSMGKCINRVKENINTLQISSKYGQASAQSWIYFAISLAFIGLSALIISKGVKSSEN